VLPAIIILVMGLLVVAAIFDIKSRIIPNWISLSIFGLYLIFLAIQWGLGINPPLVDPLTSFATGLGTLAVFTGFFYFRFIGGGDVKLIAAVAFWVGLKGIAPFIMIMAITGGVIAVFYIFKRDVGPEIEIDQEGKFSIEEEKKKKKEVKVGEINNKSAKIPYGIAISVGGLFVVNQILTILIA
jgi:prepilin peptidase CpaA